MEINMNKEFYKQPPEIEEGNREYKLKLYVLDNIKIQRFITQMKYRLYEGNGKAIYILGIQDNGSHIGISKNDIDISVEQIKRVAERLDAKVEVIRFYNGEKGHIATVRITIDEDKLSDAIF